ncbi:MAG: hypothetical protein AAB955_00730 [Patescibacteria group bacterium]
MQLFERIPARALFYAAGLTSIMVGIVAVAELDDWRLGGGLIGLGIIPILLGLASVEPEEDSYVFLSHDGRDEDTGEHGGHPRL